jgi:hypothetical protein
MVPVTELPPTTEEDESATELSHGSTVTEAVLDELLHAAVIVTTVGVVTCVPVTRNDGDVVDPAATVTFAGTDAPEVLLSVTTCPPTGAAPLNVTVAEDVVLPEVDPIIVVGESDKVATVGSPPTTSNVALGPPP